MNEKNFAKAAISIILFLKISIITVIILKYGLHFNIKGNITTIVYLDLITSLILCVVNIILNKNLIKIDIKKKLKLDTVLEDCAMFFFIKIILAIIVSNLMGLFGISNTIPENQKIVETYLLKMPLIMMISSCILAPINEELVFRGCIKGIFKNKKVFVIVSGLIFGLMHIADNIVLVFEILLIGVVIDVVKNKKLSAILIGLILLLCGSIYYLQYGNLIVKITSLKLADVFNLINYVGLSIYLAYIYVKRDNIINNVIIHAFNNTLSTLMLLFLR